MTHQIKAVNICGMSLGFTLKGRVMKYPLDFDRQDFIGDMADLMKEYLGDSYSLLRPSDVDSDFKNIRWFIESGIYQAIQ